MIPRHLASLALFVMLTLSGCANSPKPTNTGAADADGDGYGADVDCDDTDGNVHPGALETCDGVDTNCSGDELDAGDAVPWYLDRDSDTYGDDDRVLASCTQPAGYVDRGGDCDDADVSVSPAATEVCGNGVDDDCDGDDGACVLTGGSLAGADAQYTGEAAGDRARPTAYQSPAT